MHETTDRCPVCHWKPRYGTDEALGLIYCHHQAADWLGIRTETLSKWAHDPDRGELLQAMQQHRRRTLYYHGALVRYIENGALYYELAEPIEKRKYPRMKIVSRPVATGTSKVSSNRNSNVQ